MHQQTALRHLDGSSRSQFLPGTSFRMSSTIPAFCAGDKRQAITSQSHDSRTMMREVVKAPKTWRANTHTHKPDPSMMNCSWICVDELLRSLGGWMDFGVKCKKENANHNSSLHLSSSRPVSHYNAKFRRWTSIATNGLDVIYRIQCVQLGFDHSWPHAGQPQTQSCKPLSQTNAAALLPFPGRCWSLD